MYIYMLNTHNRTYAHTLIKIDKDMIGKQLSVDNKGFTREATWKAGRLVAITFLPSHSFNHF